MLLTIHLYRLPGAKRRTFRMKKFLTDTVIAYYGRELCQQRVIDSPDGPIGNFMSYPALTRLLTPKAIAHIVPSR